MELYVSSNDEISFVEDELMKHNKNCVPSTQQEDYIKYSYVMKENEKIIGGILAYSVIWGILYIDTLWVDKEYRIQNARDW